MKDIFNSRQRFSIRKFSFGAASVLLGTVLFAQAPVAHASETETTTVEQAENTEKASASTEETPQSATETPVVATTVEPTTEKAEPSKEPVVEVAEAPLAANKSALSAKIAEVEALLARAHKATDKSARDTAASALSQAKAVLAQTDASQTEVDAETAKLDLFVTVLAEASQQAQASEKAETAKAAAQTTPAEKTALEQTKSEAEVTNRLANQFVEKEAPQKNVSADLTNAIKTAVAQNEANIEQAATVLADKNATSQNYKQSMAQLQASIDAVYVSLRKSGKEEFEVALAATGVDTTALQTAIETLEKLLNSGNLTGVEQELITRARNEVTTAKTVLEGTNSTTDEVSRETRRLNRLGNEIILAIELSPETKALIEKLQIGDRDGVLVEKNQTADPEMSNANGATLGQEPPITLEGVKLQPTADDTRYTFSYMPLKYLKFAGIDSTNLNETHYVRSSRSKNPSDESVLVEVVKIADNTVQETRVLTAGQSFRSTVLNSPYGLFVGYDVSTKSETSLGKIAMYLTGFPSQYGVNSADIPTDANFITKYMTTDGKELATYVQKGTSNQTSTPSEKREFTNYEYVTTLTKSTPELNVDELDTPENLAIRYGAKVLRRVVKEDGTVVKTVWVQDPTLPKDKLAAPKGDDVTGYIKIFESEPIAPWTANTKLELKFGNETLMSNGKPLITEEMAKEIIAAAANVDKAQENLNTAGSNTREIYRQEGQEGLPEGQATTIYLGFVGNYSTVKPFGIEVPGKSLYIRNKTVLQTDSDGKLLVDSKTGKNVSGPNNFQLIPLYNELIFIKEAVHLYEPAVSVKVKYVDEDGNEITGTGKDFPSGGDKAIPTGGVTIIDKAALVEVDKQTPRYDATPERPGRIVAADGTVYVFEKVTDDSAPESDNLKKGNHVVKYRFKKATGNVVIKYENTEGVQIAGDYKDVDNQVITDPAKTYDATENDNTKQERPEKIETKDGTVYYYEGTSANINKSFYDNNTPNDKSDDKVAAPIGNVQLGTTTVTHVYDKAGSVVINYISTDGTVIKTEVADQAADGTAVTNVKKGTAYNATDKEQKPAEIKDGDKLYRLVTQAGDTRGTTVLKYDENGVVISTNAGSTDLGDNRVIAGAEGAVEAGKTKVVTYVYEEVLGKVAVKYIATDGTVLDGDVTLNDDTATTNVPTDGVEVTFGVGALTANATSGGEPYNTADKRPDKITKDGKVYYKVATTGTTTSGVNYVDGVATGAGHAAESGKVVADATQTVTYVYAPAGNVVVKYITTDGTQLTGDLVLGDDTVATNVDATGVKDETNAQPGTAYTTTDKKPKTIKVGNKVYKLVEKTGTTTGATATNYVNGVVVGEGASAEEGSVEAGVDKVVTYVYEEVKGNVVVKYIDENGNLLAGEAVMPDGSKEQITTSGVIAEKDASIGTAYDTTTKKATKITTPEGKVFELAGNVENGVVIAENSVKDGSAPENGNTAKVKEEEQTVTYVYKEVKGNVVVKYETTDGVALDGQLTADGKEITVPATGIMDTPAGGDSLGANYETFDHKVRTIVKDGKTYRLVTKEEAGKYSADGVKAGSDAEKGTVAEGTKTVTYVYEEVKQGTVIVKYEDVNGNEISPEVKVADQEEVQAGKTYDTTERKLTVIKKDNKLYQLVTKAEAGKYSADGVKVGSDAEKGDLVEGTKTVTYVYEEITPAPSKGSVIVHYVDEDGKPVDNTEIAINNKDVDTDYMTTPKEVPGYTFVKISDASAPANGKVKEGITEVTYVYKKAQTGSVVVKYVDEKGNPISGTTTGIAKPSVAATEKDVDAQGKEVTDVAVGTKYDTTDLRPQTITTADGKVYELVVEKVPANEKGDVVAGETVVTYVYKEVKGSVLVKYVTTDGTPLTGELTADGNKVTVPTTGLVDTPESSVDTAYNTQDLRPTTIVKDGVTYRLVPARTQGAETGKVVKGETVITYVYEKVQDVKRGSVVVKYVNEKGIEIKDPIYDERDQEVGKAYDTREHKPSPITGKDGKVYELVAVRGNETGSVVEGETTVTYVYREVLSPRPEQKVMTYFVDEAGNTLLAAKLGTHVAEVIPGYVLVESKTDAAGNTIHVYAKVKPGMPSQPSNPAVKPEVQPTSTKPAQAMKELPNTGTEDHAGLAALGLAGLLGGFGLVARKRKED